MTIPPPPREGVHQSSGSGWIIGLVLGGVALLLFGAAVFVLGAFFMYAESAGPVYYAGSTTAYPIAAHSPYAGSTAVPGGAPLPVVAHAPAAPEETVTTAEAPDAAVSAGTAGSAEKAQPQAGQPAAKEAEWLSLFNGKDLTGWNVTKFGGEGEVEVKDGAIVMEMGNDMTGITLAKDPPAKTNYEVRLKAQRVEGTDFFCGLTFPVKDKPCSLILGGWGGGVCGLSSINGLDASENATTTYHEFKNGQWHDVRLRVSDNKIEAWLGDEQIVDQDIRDRQLGVRVEVELSKPFGIATWQTTGAVKDVRIRKLTDAEVKEIDATLEDQ